MGSPLPPTTVSSALAILLVTTSVLTRTALPPPLRPTGLGNPPPARRLSLGPPPSHRSSSRGSSSSSTNSAYHPHLPPTPPITPPTAIPFGNPASPFVSPQQYQQPHPQRHSNSSSSSSASSLTSNNNNSNSTNNNSHHLPQPGAVASRFSPPQQNSHSQGLPARHLAAGGGVGLPLQAVHQQTYHPQHHTFAPHSRPSHPLSPNPSPHQGNPHQYSHPYSQAGAYDDLQQSLVQEQLPQHISQAGILSAAGEQDWRLLQNYPYTNLDVAVSPTTQSSWEEHTQRMTPPEAVDGNASTHRHPQMDRGAMTHRFHSTHPHSPTHQHSLGNEHSDLTATAATMMHSGAQVQPGHRPHHPQQEAPPRGPSTSTGPNPVLSLVASQSWNYAMTQQLQMHPPPEHFFPYPAPPGLPQHLAGSQPQALGQQQHLQAMPDEWLAAMNPSQSQQAPFHLQDPRLYRPDGEAHPLSPMSAYSNTDLPPHQAHRRSGASPPMIKYESPSLLVSQLPLLPE